MEIEEKKKKAAQLLLFKKKLSSEELKRKIGKNYEKILEILQEEFKGFGLKIKSIEHEGNKLYFISLDDAKIDKANGLRIDDLSILAYILSILFIKEKCKIKEIEEILKEKFPIWKIRMAIKKFEKMGYLEINDFLKIGWRAKAEIDEKKFLELIFKHGLEKFH